MRCFTLVYIIPRHVCIVYRRHKLMVATIEKNGEFNTYPADAGV